MAPKLPQLVDKGRIIPSCFGAIEARAIDAEDS